MKNEIVVSLNLNVIDKNHDDVNIVEKNKEAKLKSKKRSRKRVLGKGFSKINSKFKERRISNNANMRTLKSSSIDKNKIKFNSTKFEICKTKHEFEPTVNYYIEYWKMFNENEYILAKIKENLYEINNMKGHLQELRELNKDS